MGNWGGKYLNQTAFRAALGALLLAVVLCAGASAQVADNGPPLEGDAYTAEYESRFGTHELHLPTPPRRAQRLAGCGWKRARWWPA